MRATRPFCRTATGPLRQWSLDDRKVVDERPGTSAVAPTFDGGFAALQIDVEAGAATPSGLNAHLDTITWPESGQSHVWPWGTSPIAFASAVAGELTSAGESRRGSC